MFRFANCLRAVFFVLVTVIVVAVQAETIVLQPGPEDGVDVWITSYYSYGSDYGVDEELIRVGGWGDYYYGLIRFDLVSLSGQSCSVQSACLELYCVNNNGGYGTTPMYLDRVLSDWDEETGWFTKPSTEFVTGVEQPTVGAWCVIDVTELCQGWLNNSVINFGVQLRPHWTWNQWSQFCSSDYSDPNLRPRLVIEYESGSVDSPFIHPVEPWGPSIPGDPECLFGGDWPSCMTKKSCDKEQAPRPFVHCGFDAKASAGTPVVAIADGTVVICRPDIGGGWGGVVVIEHCVDGYPIITASYLHVEPVVDVGDPVAQGDVIAYVANIATGPHLHFGVREGAYNPKEKQDIYYKGALAPVGTRGKCKTCSGNSFVPEFPEQWMDPEKLFE